MRAKELKMNILQNIQQQPSKIQDTLTWFCQKFIIGYPYSSKQWYFYFDR
jgi:hypothetical protein